MPPTTLLCLPVEMLIEVSKRLDNAPDLFAFAGACSTLHWALGGVPEVARRFALVGARAVLDHCPEPAQEAAVRLFVAGLGPESHISLAVTTRKLLTVFALRRGLADAARSLIGLPGPHGPYYSHRKLLNTFHCLCIDDCVEGAALMLEILPTSGRPDSGTPSLWELMFMAVRRHTRPPATAAPGILRLLLEAAEEGKLKGADEARQKMENGELAGLGPICSHDAPRETAAAVWELTVETLDPDLACFNCRGALASEFPEVVRHVLGIFRRASTFPTEALWKHLCLAGKTLGRPEILAVFAEDPQFPPDVLYFLRVRNTTDVPELERLLRDPGTFLYDLFELTDRVTLQPTQGQIWGPLSLHTLERLCERINTPEGRVRVFLALAARPEVTPGRAIDFLEYWACRGRAEAIRALLPLCGESPAPLRRALAIATSVTPDANAWPSERHLNSFIALLQAPRLAFDRAGDRLGLCDAADAFVERAIRPARGRYAYAQKSGRLDEEDAARTALARAEAAYVQAKRLLRLLRHKDDVGPSGPAS